MSIIQRIGSKNSLTGPYMTPRPFRGQQDKETFQIPLNSPFSALM